jgi:hypothetical protein
VSALGHSTPSGATATSTPVGGLGADATLPLSRLTGRTRDAETAAATDPVTVGAVARAATAAQPLRRVRVTYDLPHQNMEEGHFHVVLGEDVDVSAARFKMLSLLGEGTFGKVVEAWDRTHKVYCAVKIVRNQLKYSRDAEYEIRFMERIRHADPRDDYPLMKILRHFRNDGGHVCIAGLAST